MKSVLLSFILLVAVITGSLAFRSTYEGSAAGTISPANAATSAWMISGTDTFKTQVKNTSFEFPNVKRGTYTLIIEAVPPYKNGMKANVNITDGSTTNIGEILLTQ